MAKNSGFCTEGANYPPTKHSGIDWDLDGGTNDTFQVFSAGYGTVTNVKQGSDADSNMGNFITIKSFDGLTSAYAHLKDGSITVTEGQNVSMGTVIAKAGMTGLYAQSGVHLHYSMTSAWHGWNQASPNTVMFNGRSFLKSVGVVINAPE